MTHTTPGISRPSRLWRGQDKAGRWHKLVSVVTLLYLIRVPVLVLAVLAVLPWAAIGPARALLQNLLVGLPGWHVFLVSMLSFFVAATAVVAINLVLLNGDERLGKNLGLQRHYRRRVYLLGLILGSQAPALAAWTGQDGWPWNLLAVVMGLLLVIGSTILTRVAHAVLVDTPSPLIVTENVNPLFEHFEQVATRNARRIVGPGARSEQGRARHLGKVLGRVLPKEGYRKPMKDGGWGDLYSGHLYAMFFSGLTLLVYLSIAVLKGVAVGREDVFPAVGFLFLLLLLICWILSGLTFLLDRHRIPIVTVLLAFMVLGGIVRSDHVYGVLPQQIVVRSTPTALLERHEAQTVVLVAAAGGGIQAAGWTARVLCGLEEELPPGVFSGATRLVSGVSGGSVGVMYFLNALAEGGGATALAQCWENAMRPSLADIAWGLAVPDFLSTFLPLPIDRALNRGWALEQSFAVRTGLGDTPLSEWTEAATGGGLPAVIFGSTIVETGMPLIFSTSTYGDTRNSGAQTSFYQLAQGALDVPVVTAVRLSAAFPYVSPASRASRISNSRLANHVVDGGYFDNLGIVSLAGWLDEGFRLIGEPSSLQRILVLQIESFPPVAQSVGQRRGWPFQVSAPLLTLLNTRTAAQSSNARTLLELLGRTLEARGIRVDVVPIHFAPSHGCSSADPPLSWRLRDEEKRCILEAWDAVKGAVTTTLISAIAQ